MPFHLGPPPSSLDEADLRCGRWQRIWYLSGWVGTVGSLVVGIVCVAVVLRLWVGIAGRFTPDTSLGVELLLIWAAACALGLFVSWMALRLVGGGRTIHWGFWPSRLWPYWFVTGALSKRRFAVVVASPAVVLVVLPMAVAAMFGARPVWLSLGTVFVALVFGAQLLWAVILAIQVPRTAVVENYRADFYWCAEPIKESSRKASAV